MLNIKNIIGLDNPCSLLEKLFDNLSTALAKHHANGDTSMVTEIVNLCPIM